MEPGISTLGARPAALFREEALAHRAAGDQETGDILRDDPRWLKVGVYLVAAAALSAFVFSLVFSVDEYASGPAVVRIEGRRVMTASAGGPVEAVRVQAGQKVSAGDILVRMTAKEEDAELARATSEYDAQLVHYLVDPHDVLAKQQLSALRARRDGARNAVEAKTIRATVAGMVSDVRVKPGQPVTLGEVLCAIVPSDAAKVSLVALVPADYRPMLRTGLPMRFELDGFRYEYADVAVEEVSSEAIGPAEVARLLGNERDGSVALEAGGKVFVTGTLPASTFTSEGQPYAYFDGLTGKAEVRVRREPVLVTLVPALRSVFSRVAS